MNDGLSYQQWLFVLNLYIIFKICLLVVDREQLDDFELVGCIALLDSVLILSVYGCNTVSTYVFVTGFWFCLQ